MLGCRWPIVGFEKAWGHMGHEVFGDESLETWSSRSPIGFLISHFPFFYSSKAQCPRRPDAPSSARDSEGLTGFCSSEISGLAYGPTFATMERSSPKVLMQLIKLNGPHHVPMLSTPHQLTPPLQMASFKTSPRHVRASCIKAASVPASCTLLGGWLGAENKTWLAKQQPAASAGCRFFCVLPLAIWPQQTTLPYVFFFFWGGGICGFVKCLRHAVSSNQCRWNFRGC